jgi:hypothetical protein
MWWPRCLKRQGVFLFYRNKIILHRKKGGGMDAEASVNLNSLVEELRSAVGRIAWEKLTRMVLRIFCRAAMSTFINKGRSLTNSFRWLLKALPFVVKYTAKVLFASVKLFCLLLGLQFGKLLTELVVILYKTYSEMDKIFDRTAEITADIIKYFMKKTAREKKDLLIMSVTFFLIALATAGGLDREGGLPDSDLKFGIKGHRNIISHTIVTGLVMEFTIRVFMGIVNEVYSNLPIDHHKIWDVAKGLADKYEPILVSAGWAGLSLHLIKDSGLFHGMNIDIKRYVDIPIPLSDNFHQMLFGTNSLFSIIFSADEIKREVKPEPVDKVDQGLMMEVDIH